MVPVDRATFKEYCLRRLGKPVIEINVDDDQVDDRVDEAIRFYYDYHFDGTEKTYYKYQITDADIANGFIRLPDNIIGAVELFDLPGSYSVNNMFSIRYQIALNDLYTLTNVNITPYYMAMTYVAFLEQMLVGRQPIRYNRNTNLFYIDTDWSLMLAGQYIIVVAYQVVNPDVYVRAWGDLYLQRLASAYIKRQWGSNLTKFTNIPMQAGMMFNGEKIYNDAEKEITEIEQMIRDSSLPATDMIG
jgi:hypothetical protein